MKHLCEELKVDNLILPVSTTGAVNPIIYVDMQDYHEAIIVVSGTLAGVESVSVQAREAEDAVGTGVANLGAAIVMDSLTNPLVYINVSTDAMTDGSRFLGVQLTVTGTAEVSAVILRGKPRYEAVTQVVDTSLVID